MSLVITEELIARQPAEAQAIIRLLLARIAELEARLGKTPQNSSLPPSSQHPHAKPPRNKKRSKKKRGGQPGHVKHERPLLPPDECNEVISLKPTTCRPGCGETTCAELPAGVPHGQAGPRLVAFTALLMAYYRQSERQTAKFLETLLDQPCCPAWTVKLQTQAAAALSAAYDGLASALPDEPHLNIDETASKQCSKKTWLWTFVAASFTIFAIRPHRKAAALTDLLGEQFAGVATCDRAKMYWCLDKLQWC